MSDFTSPAVQAMKLIRHIGDEVSQSGKPLARLSNFREIIGSPTEEFAETILDALWSQKLVQMNERGRTGGGSIFRGDVSLTLDGWERYEAEKRGEFNGNYGFIAMQFDNSELDNFVNAVVKPAVKDGIGYKLVDMKDIARAGIIDNIMRIEIRDAAFVIVDLTHSNPGAYWEAGYAEGLGKPVIYICKKEMFEAEGTHFDTNHCTTIPWSRKDEAGFREQLIATLRRSLDQYS